MTNSRKKTLGFLSIIVLLCACLFFVSTIGNTSRKAYAASSSVDLTQEANFTIGTADDLAFTSVDGVVGPTANDNDTFENHAVIVPTATANGANFSIGYAFKTYAPVKFATPLELESGIDTLKFTINAHLSSAATYCGVDGTAGSWGGVGILIYPLGATGDLGQGTLIPWNVAQDTDTVITVGPSQIANYLNADGKVEGFAMASVIAGRTYGSPKTLYTSGAYLNVKSVEAVCSVKTLTQADFTNGKATLLSGNDDYTTDTSALSIVNGVTSPSHSGQIVKPGYDNLNDLTVANTGAYYSFADMKAASNDGYGIAMEITNWGLTSYPNLLFKNKVKVSDIGSLTMRVFANLNNSEYGKPYAWYNSATKSFCNDAGGNGIYFYGIGDARESGNGVMLNPYVRQREWTELTFTGTELAKLADADGYISGFSLGGYHIGDGPAQMYGNSWNSGHIGHNNYDKVACIIIDDITVTSATAVEDEVVLFDGNTNGKVIQTAHQKVEGMEINSLKEAWPALAPAMGNPVGYNNKIVDLNDLTPATEGEKLYDLGAVKEGSEDGHAMGMSFSINGYTMSPTVYFNQVVNTSNVKSVTFRIYANISSQTPYGLWTEEEGFKAQATMRDSAGIYIYSADKNGAGDGVLIKADVAQREWIDITLCKNDLRRLADANGNIAGFKIGAGFVLNGGFGPYMYNQEILADKSVVISEFSNALFVDSVTAYKDHPESDWIVYSEATCTEAGLRYTECTNCGEVVKEEEIPVDPTNHTPGEWVDEVPQTCVAEGVKGHYQCEDCEVYLDEDFNVIDDLTIAPAHNYGDWIAETPATCTAVGEKGHYHCEGCDKNFDSDYNEITDLTISMIDHNYGEWIDEVPATGEAEGVKGHYHCDACEKNFDAEYNEIADLTIEKVKGCGGQIGSEVSAPIAIVMLVAASAIICIRRKKEN